MMTPLNPLSPLRGILPSLAAVAASCLALVAHATTVVPPEFSALVNESDYIIRAVTTSVTPAKQPDSKKIVTRVTFEVLEAIAGSPPATVTLVFLGGEVDGQRMTVEGMPRFRVGDEDILFVSANGRSICPLYGMMHGRYLVSTDRETGRKSIARFDGTPLHSTAQITAAADAGSTISRSRAAMQPALHPDDFIRQIKAAVRLGSHVTRAQ